MKMTGPLAFGGRTEPSGMKKQPENGYKTLETKHRLRLCLGRLSFKGGFMKTAVKKEKFVAVKREKFVQALHNVKAFIVPNTPMLVSFEYARKWGSVYLDEGCHGDMIYVELWLTCDEYENVAAHGGPIRATFFPLHLFKGKKEGDVIEIGDYSVTLQQQGFRYQRFGLFEDVLNDLLDCVLRDPNFSYGDTDVVPPSCKGMASGKTLSGIRDRVGKVLKAYRLAS